MKPPCLMSSTFTSRPMLFNHACYMPCKLLRHPAGVPARGKTIPRRIQHPLFICDRLVVDSPAANGHSTCNLREVVKQLESNDVRSPGLLILALHEGRERRRINAIALLQHSAVKEVVVRQATAGDAGITKVQNTFERCCRKSFLLTHETEIAWHTAGT